MSQNVAKMHLLEVLAADGKRNEIGLPQRHALWWIRLHRWSRLWLHLLWFLGGGLCSGVLRHTVLRRP